MCTPGAVVEVTRIDGPAAVAAGFGEGRGGPCFPGLAIAPWAVTHETHQLAVTVSTISVVADSLRGFRFLWFEAGSIAPGAVVPVRRDSLVAAGADVREGGPVVVTVSSAFAEGAEGHPFGNGLAAIETWVKVGQDSPVAFYKSLSSLLFPVMLSVLG